MMLAYILRTVLYCTALHFCRQEPLISYLDKIDGKHSFMSGGEEDEEDEGQGVKKIKLENFKKQGNTFTDELDDMIDQESSSPPACGKN